MIFKVKQKSQIDYSDLVTPRDSIEVTQATAGDMTVGTVVTGDGTSQDEPYKVSFNWPYDFFSMVEMVKLDAEILYKGSSEDDEVLGVRETDELAAAALNPNQDMSAPQRSARANQSQRPATTPSLNQQKAPTRSATKNTTQTKQRSTSKNIKTKGGY